ncbi:hypothetical protein LCGC14_2239410 [marine sediment metagenome]|uniref:Cdc6 AAA+ ATPase-type lid domain-containing protein n=1 Tax=marine sediment metagenome TaxID=412755 RepID=A0A0F9FIG0_9ZZZZ
MAIERLAWCEISKKNIQSNIEQIKKILEERINQAFIPNSVQEPALNLCAALAGSEHGDARRDCSALA